MATSNISLLLGFSAMLSVSLLSRVTARSCTIICLGVNGHLVSGHEISRLQHGLQLIMARYTRIINCRPCCNLYLFSHSRAAAFVVNKRRDAYTCHLEPKFEDTYF